MADKIFELYGEIKVRGLQKVKTDLKGIETNTKNASKQMKTGFKGSIGSIVGVTAALAAARAAFVFLKDAITKAIDSAKAFAKVRQAVKITGEAAGFSARELSKIADQLSKIAGIDEDRILNDVTAQLLTFTNIIGPAFERAQQAALDLSAVLGSDLKQQTIQLAKALEDPIKGVTALSRAGVTFTTQQREQIRVMVEANDLYGAQNIILGEIEAKYGGQAEAINKVDVGLSNMLITFDNIVEEIGQGIIPILGEMISGLQTVLRWLGILSGEEFSIDTRTAIKDLIRTGATLESINNARRLLISEIGDEIIKETQLWRDVGVEINKVGDAHKQIEILQQVISEKTQEESDLLTQLIGKKGTERKAIEDQIRLKRESIRFDKESISELQDAIALFNEGKKVQDDILSGRREGVKIVLKTKQLEQDLIDSILAKRTDLENKVKAINFALDNQVLTEQEINDLLLERFGLLGQIEKLQAPKPPDEASKIIEEDKFEDFKLSDVTIPEPPTFIGVVEEMETMNQLGINLADAFLIMGDNSASFASKLSAVISVITGIASAVGIVQAVIAAAQGAAVVTAQVTGAGIAAAYATPAALASIASFGGAAVAGGAALTTTVALANALALPKFAFGGEATVPPGMGGDSGLIRVSSGETVRVRTAGQTGNDIRILESIDNKLSALNKNTAAVGSEVRRLDLKVDIDAKSLVKKVLKPAENKLAKSGLNLDAL